jgi:tRNA threonylcarbamoyl adenosine modification protein YjeE
MNLFSTTFAEPEMCAFARALAPLLCVGDCVALTGDLGAGKSTFARAVITELTSATDVPSPTYTLVQHYEGRQGPIWHFDLYRLKARAEIYELGWEEALPQALVLVEWPELVKELLPLSTLSLKLSLAPSGGRIMELQGNQQWAARLLPLLKKTT